MDQILQFISDFKANCPNDKISIVAHSLGAKVVVSALISLDNNNQTWKKIQHIISSP
jgi:esterase/lipase superfamily enzyme